MTFVPFGDSDLLAEIFAPGQVAPGLDGIEVALWHPSIGPDGSSGKEVFGAPVPPERTVNWADPLAKTVYHTASAYDRELLKADLSKSDYDGMNPDDIVDEVRDPVGIDEANVLSSALVDEHGAKTGFHTIALDIDHPVRVRPTDTPGHYHLFIDVPMPWEEYRAVLEALTEAGVVESGYYSASEAREATNLRLPWVHKAPKPGKIHVAGFEPAGEEVPSSDSGYNPDTGTIKLVNLDLPPADLSWNADEYEVEFVDGKGVLRRRKA